MTRGLYKVTGEDGSAFHGGQGVWPLPNGEPGAWVEAEGDLVPCKITDEGYGQYAQAR